ncbi:MAG: serine hydrolase [Lachnospiraceae bacterium]|nr:serine hydrolase [Lachnospiraceae bacterium]
MNFEKFVEDIKINNWNVFGVEVYVDGKLLHSYGDTIDTRYPIYSATKTITSIAVGIAVDEGKLDINKSVLDYLPSNVVNSMPEKQVEIYKNITTKDLLTMSVSGYPFRPEGESWLVNALNYPVSLNGEFSYSNISAYLAGVVASCAVGEDLYQYLDRKLFEPLGIIKPTYERCPDGYFYGASMMELTVHELSKIGLLLYDNGIYEGKRILSEEYVREATSIQQMNREGGYGYFIWKYRNGYSINGKWKQKCYVLPNEKIMATYLSHIEDELPELKESMERNILGL